MKMITAIIRESCLDQVREALFKADISRITVTRVAGHGRQLQEQVYRGHTVIPALTSKVRLDIAVNEDFVDITCNTILESAHTDNVGDGKIFILPLEECIRIRTDERGGKAI